MRLEGEVEVTHKQHLEQHWHIKRQTQRKLYCWWKALVQGVRTPLAQTRLSAGRRMRLEGEVEVAYKQRLEQRCYNERLTQQKLYRWGQSEKARSMELPGCSELNSRFGHRMPFYSY